MCGCGEQGVAYHRIRIIGIGAIFEINGAYNYVTRSEKLTTPRKYSFYGTGLKRCKGHEVGTLQ